MNLDQLKDDSALRTQIAVDEGIRSTPYRDTMGIWTAGIGHNLEAHGAAWSEIAGWLRTGIPDTLIKEWFSEDIGAAVTCCGQVFEGFAGFPDEAQRILVNMAFDLMYELWEWKHLRSCVAAANWKGAALSILQSRFATQGPKRAARLAARMQAIK